jgi:hypothetical protein
MAQASENLVAPLQVLRRLVPWFREADVTTNAEVIWDTQEVFERDAELGTSILLPQEQNRTAIAKRTAELAERKINTIQDKWQEGHSNEKRSAAD